MPAEVIALRFDIFIMWKFEIHPTRLHRIALSFFYYIALKHDPAVLSKNILDKVILLTLLLTALCGRSGAHSNYELQTTFFEMDPASRDSAIHTLSTQHFKRPGNSVFIRQLAEAYTAKNNIDSALKYWQLYTNIEGSNDTSFYTQAQLYYSINSFDSAFVCIHDALALQPDRILYAELLAVIDYRLEKADSALSICENILARSPSDVNALLLSGIILRDQKKNAEALERFDRCLKADPANTDALIHRADEYVLLKKYTDAMRDYSAARADLSKNADILNNIGICCYESGAYQEAISYFKKAIASNHQHPQSYYNKGLSYYHLNDLDTASLDIKKASAIWDTCHTDTCHAYFLDAIYYLGMCYKKIGDLPAARSHFVLLQKEKYPKDLSTEIKLIDYSLFISQNWYYFLLLFFLTIGLIVVLVRIMRRG